MSVKLNKSIDRLKLVTEVKSLMAKGEFVSQPDLTEKYECSRASFYNIMHENNIDIKSYNTEVKEKLNIPSNRKIEKMNSAETPKIEIISREEMRKIEDSKYKNTELELIKSGDDYQIYRKTKSTKNVSSVIEENQGYIDTENISGEDVVVYNYTPSSSNVLTVTLINNRHELIDSSSNPYIYKGPIKSYMIHDYEKLYEIAEEFILANVVEAGYNKLRLTVTGLTQCVTSVIKVCYKYNINLTLLHYDNVTGKYHEQVIFGKDDKEESSLLSLYYNSKRYYKYKLINHDTEYYSKLKNLYIIKIENLTDNTPSENECYITDDINLMFKIYGDKIQKLKDEKFTSYRVLADEIAFGATNMEYQFIQSYGSFYNMPRK